VLDGADIHDEIRDMIREFAINALYDGIADKPSWEEWDVEKINGALNNRVLPPEYNFVTNGMIEGVEAEELAEKVAEEALKVYEGKCRALKEINIDHQRIEREILLRVVDSLWRDHIDFMEILRGEIGLRAYGNHDPIIAFKEESSRAYETMINKVREETAMFLINFRVQIERKVPVNVTAKKLTQEDLDKIKKITEEKIKEKEALAKAGKGGSATVTPKEVKDKMDANVKKLMNAKTSIDMITNDKSTTQAKTQGKLVGRNDLCPCGSGKKYKQCCGKDKK
jgi:preprotein translocase subunit SecA